MSSQALELRQIGPGQYRADFQVGEGGSYLVNLRYRREGPDDRPALVQTVVNVPYAPEFDDLTDNAALLAELAETTGGRVLPSDPAKADLFSRAGLEPPKAAIPLTEPLFLAWVVLFLLDVGVRRIAIDVRGIARRLAARIRRQREAVENATLAALKKRRDSVRLRLGAQGKDAHAGQKFVAKDGSADRLPETDLSRPPDKPRPMAQEPSDQPAKPAEDARTHVSRLLDAKRRVTGPRKDE
jgi:hypothetical protein